MKNLAQRAEKNRQAKRYHPHENNRMNPCELRGADHGGNARKEKVKIRAVPTPVKINHTFKRSLKRSEQTAATQQRPSGFQRLTQVIRGRPVIETCDYQGNDDQHQCNEEYHAILFEKIFHAMSSIRKKAFRRENEQRTISNSFADGSGRRYLLRPQ